MINFAPFKIGLGHIRKQLLPIVHLRTRAKDPSPAQRSHQQ